MKRSRKYSGCLSLLAALVALVTGCENGITALADNLRDPATKSAAAELGASQSRLAEAVRKRDTAATATGAAKSPAIMDVEERIDRLRGIDAPAVQGANAPERPVTEWEAAAAHTRIAQLVAARDELLLRGSGDWHRFNAEVGWELHHLRGLNRKFDLSLSVPDNEYEFLSKTALDDLTRAWQQHALAVRAQVAARPGIPSTAVEKVTAQLARVELAAKAGKPVDLSSSIRSALAPQKRAKIETWSKERAAARESEIGQRHLQSLRDAAARDVFDLQPKVLLAMAQGPRGPPGTANSAAVDSRGRLVVARERSLRTQPGFAQSTNAAELLAKRFTDPIAATQYEALLHLQWQELKSIKSRTQREKVLPAALSKSFPDFLASQLSDADLEEIRLQREIERGVLRERAAAVPGFASQPLEVDLNVYDQETQALDREIAYRKDHHASRAPVADDGLHEETVALLEQHRVASISNLDSSQRGRFERYNALRRYQASTPQPHPEAERQRRSIELAAFETEGREWILLADRVRAVRMRVTKNGFADMTDRDKLKAASDTAAEIAGWFDRAIRHYHADDPKRVREVRSALTSAVVWAEPLEGPEPPPPPPPPHTSPWDGWNPPDEPSGGAMTPKTDPPMPPPEGSGNYVPTAFHDGYVARGRANLERLLTVLEKEAPSRPAVAEASPAVVLYKDAVEPEISGAGRRPAMEGWRRDDGSPRISYNDLDELKSKIDIPGGVAFGRDQLSVIPPTLKGKFGLVYLPNEKRLAFVLEGGAKLRLQVASPDVLRASYLYARDRGTFDKDTIGVSIGYSGNESSLSDKTVARVYLHPALRDTQVGRDIIDADRLPWSLKDKKLPNGSENPFRDTMKTLLEAALEADGVLPVTELLNHVRNDGHILYDSGESIDSDVERSALITAIAEPMNDNPRIDNLVAAVADANDLEARFAKFNELEDAQLTRQIFQDLSRELREKAATGGGTINEEKLSALEGDTHALKALLPQNDRARIAKSRQAIRVLFKSLPSGESLKDRAGAMVTLLLLVTGSYHHDRESTASEYTIPWSTLVRTTLAVAAAAKSDEPLTLKKAANEVLRFFGSADVSLLTDQEIRLDAATAPNELSAVARLRIRYVRGVLKPDAGGIRVTNESAADAVAGDKATALMDKIEEVYPAMRNAREDAAWIGLFRWALVPGHVAWLDLADLASEEKQHVRTPDYICHDDRKRCQTLLARMKPMTRKR